MSNINCTLSADHGMFAYVICFVEATNIMAYEYLLFFIRYSFYLPKYFELIN